MGILQIAVRTKMSAIENRCIVYFGFALLVIKSDLPKVDNARVNRADEKCKLVKTESDTMGGHDHPTTCPPQRLRTLRFNALLSLQPMFSVP